jgi:ATP-dependent protease ClpP protease subunit
MRRGIFASFFLTIALPASAAEITVGGAAIVLNGLIGPDDAETFQTKANLFPGKATAILNSPGGNLLAGLAIGEFLRLRGWSTYVSGECDSACAFIWLGGAQRLMTPDAKIGFHSASINGQETGLGNAVLAAYLNRIGLSREAAVYVTQTGPDDITYLTPLQAKRMGIEVGVTGRDAGAPFDQAGQLAPAPKPTTRKAGYVQAESEASFLVRYLFSNTSNNAQTLAAVYWGYANYYGKMTSVSDIVADKQRFIETWPSRIYTIRSMTPAHCGGDNGIIVECQVSGIVDWEASGSTKKSMGSSSFEYVLKPWPLGSWSIDEGGQLGLRIASENGKTLSRKIVDLAPRLSAKPGR